ncbi:MAG: hypothetical protein WAZ77_14820 [Candidatus Nitrosopolaris sp.]
MPSLPDGKELHRSIHKEAAVFNQSDSSSTSIGAVNILLPRIEIAKPLGRQCPPIPSFGSRICQKT